MNSAKPAVSIQRDAITQISSGLLAHVSHDMGTPVSALRGYIRMMLDGRAGELTDQQKEYLSVALESADRLRRLALRLGKAPDFIEKLQPEAIDVRQAWLEALEGRSHGLAEKAVLFTDQGLKDGFLVVGDVEQLRRVLELVADAAIQAASPGSTATVEFSRHHDHYVHIRICLPRLVASEVGRGAEAHLSEDLSTVDNIVFLHGGEFSFDSQAELGPTFTLDLPSAEVGNV